MGASAPFFLIMATSTVATDTELSAVNSILGAIGQSPLTTLNFTNPETAFVYNILEESIKDVLNEGWHFNTEHHVEVTPDSNGNFIIPSSYLRYDVYDKNNKDIDVVKRDGKLYDKVQHTFVFTDPLLLDVVFLYTFTDIPSVFQRYIVAKASSRAAAQLVANAETYKLLQQQEATTRAAVMEYDCNQGDYSFFGWSDETHYIPYQPYKSLSR